MNTAAGNKLLSSVANTTTKSLTNAVNSVQEFASESTSTIASAANSAINSAMGAIGSTTTTLGTALNSAATTTLNSIPGMNSILPMGNSNKKNNTGYNNSYYNNANKNGNANRYGNANRNGNANSYGNSNENANRNNNSNATNSAANSSWLTSYASLFLLLMVLSFLLFTAFSREIELAYRNLVMSIRSALGYPAIDVMDEDDSENNVVTPVESTAEQTAASSSEKSILQKLLPLSSPEVFNVNQNEYSYYDAEPLCKALGAELATYDQVKDAWASGADWCNYGWVKGQVAVYPIQTETYNKIQSGPEDERGACGNPGVNGGYFDNPEMKFGVNCYGPKPEESAADEAALMKNGTIPRTPATLKVDQKTQEFKANLSTTTVSPFNSKKWASS